MMNGIIRLFQVVIMMVTLAPETSPIGEFSSSILCTENHSIFQLSKMLFVLPSLSLSLDFIPTSFPVVVPVPIVLIRSKFSNLYSPGFEGASSSELSRDQLADIVSLDEPEGTDWSVDWLGDLIRLVTLCPPHQAWSGATRPYH